jgi:hypothetical protein
VTLLRAPSQVSQSRWRGSVLARTPGLARLTAATLLSETADQFALVAMLWVVLLVSHSPADAGLVVLCRRVPEIVFGPLLGSRFDRWPAVPLTIAGFALRAAAFAVIAVMAQPAMFNIRLILIVCLVSGAANPLAKVGTRVMLPAIVSTADLQVANGVLTIGDQFPYLVGPALGGALAGLAGASSLFVPVGMCVAAVIVIAGVRRGTTGQLLRAASRAGHDSPAGGTGWFGFRPLLTIAVARAMMTLTVIYYVSYGPLLPAMPLYAQHQLHAGGAGYGAMWSVMGVGALAGLVMIPRLRRFRPAIVNAVGIAVWGVVLLPLLIVHALLPALIVMFAGGVVWAPYVATEVSVLQHWVPRRLHGAAFGARRSVIVASSPTGAALGGLLLEHMSAAQVIGLSAGACLLGGLASLALPSVRGTPPITAGPETTEGGSDDPA